MSIKDIKRRIKSVNNTKKVTRAMEMVAAAKMRRAIESVLATRTYANLSWGTVLNLSRSLSNNGELHPLFQKREDVKKVGIVLMSSNRGLCGGFNANLIAKVHKSIQKHHHLGESGEVKAEFIVLGKKGAAAHKHYGYDIVAEFTKLDVANELKEVVQAAKIIIKDYTEGKYDKVMVAYTDYISASKQEPRVKQLLPIDIETDDDYLGVVGGDSRVGTEKKLIYEKQDKYLQSEAWNYEYVFEPSPEEVLQEIMPRLVEVQLYQALLESNASEHSARMQAMHQATDAAGELVDDLTLYYNKARQAKITNEIAEISAGANALA